MSSLASIAAATIARPRGENPNRGKRSAARPRVAPRLSCPRNERTADGDIVRGGVTVVRVNPAYLKRYGAAASVTRADANQRSGATTGGATVVGRNATRQHVRTLTKS